MRSVLACSILSTQQAKDGQRSGKAGEGGSWVVKSRCDLENACMMKEKQ